MADYSRYSHPVSQLIFTTSDQVASKLYILFDGSNIIQSKVLKEYIYLKCFLCIVKMRNIVSDSPENVKKVTEDILSEIIHLLDQGFKRDIFSNYGCNINELTTRINYYYSRVDFDNDNTMCQEFIGVIGIDNIVRFNLDIFQINELINECSQLIDEKLLQCAKSKSQSGCGCTSAIACFGLIAIIIISAFI